MKFVTAAPSLACEQVGREVIIQTFVFRLVETKRQRSVVKELNRVKAI